MKSNYLFVCDYGTGGVWGIMRANSKEQILNKYPRLKIFDRRPSWMSEADFSNIEAKSSFDIDNPPSGWMAEMAKDSGSI